MRSSREKRRGEVTLKRRRRGRTVAGLTFLAAALGTVAVLKCCFPQETIWVRDQLSAQVSQLLPIGEAVEAMGRAVTGEGEIQEVWNVLGGNSRENAAREVGQTVQDRNVSGVLLLSAGDVNFKELFTSQERDEGVEETDPELEEEIIKPRMVHDVDIDLSEEDLSDDTSDVPVPDKVDLNIYRFEGETVTPVHGRITSDFGYRDHPVDGEYKFHYGIDIAAKAGTDILCFADGEVTALGYSKINGNYLKVTHADGYVTMYAHCSKIYAKEGQQVKTGEVIAAVGMTGNTTGNHLHFQVYRNEKLLNPNHYVTP